MYKVNLYKGDYRDRQKKANTDKCMCYVEQHFNSSTSLNADYSVVITGSNASQTSKNWGRWYAQAVAREFDLPLGGDRGIKVGGFNGRGDFNLRYTEMPAILLEPLFASNPQHADWIRNDEKQIKLASILSESIHRFFQNEGIVAFSIGHKYKESRPDDRGAKLYGDGNEADYAEIVLEKAGEMLKQLDGIQEERLIKVIQKNETIWTHAVDADDDITWDPVRGVLSVN